MQILLQFLVPIIVFFVSIVSIVAVVLAAFADPEGAVNTFLIKMIDLIHPIFPSTPDDLKIFSLLDSVADKMPLAGRAIVYDIAQTVGIIVGLLLVIKIYKLIPFKAT